MVTMEMEKWPHTLVFDVNGAISDVGVLPRQFFWREKSLFSLELCYMEVVTIQPSSSVQRHICTMMAWVLRMRNSVSIHCHNPRKQ